jgi:release factor glutamine methyltransferase
VSEAARSWTVLELLRWTTGHFAGRGIESARLDAECLLAHALGTSRLALYLEYDKPVLPQERTAFRELVRRRGAERVPVAQLVGRKEFWSLPLAVTSAVLTPRPETETLVEAVLARLPDAEGEYRILDIGTGAGPIALALAHERPKASVVATDVSPAALQIAAENADQLRLSDRVRFAEGRLFDPVAGERFDAVVSNPPYLARGAEVGPELAHEPAEALFAGEDGLEVLRPLAAGAHDALREGGWVAMEIDPGQAEVVAALLAEAGLEGIEILRDLARRPRVAVARRPGA